jgi:hypothetical protein
MQTVHTEVSAVIDAPPAEVYAIFADYRNAHPQVLPKPYFGDLVVEKGGNGAGTVYRTSVTSHERYGDGADHKLSHGCDRTRAGAKDGGDRRKIGCGD